MGGFNDYIRQLCNQTAVYWADPQPNGYGGNTYTDPVEIRVFWIDKIETITDKNGQELTSKAQVIVTQDMDDRGILFNGTLDDMDSAAEDDPRKILNAFEIRSFNKVFIPGSTTEVFRMVYL